MKSISDEDEEVLAQCVKGKPWGSGPRDFMRKLFNLAVQRNVNFFDSLLEPLFYDALNKNRGEQGYCPTLHCRIPFLSGGLFEPIEEYDWKHNDFSIPNEIFSNADIKGRDADGILDIFDRYNFTMSEDEPMEREVAIDPEMLGKVFENLLEINDRKSKGAFYTPREIVHYMCQETLINYLAHTLELEEEDIRDFILYGDFMKDEDTVKEKREGNGEMYISEKLFKIDSNGKIVVDRLKDMDKALQDVRVADPAVGSGAFPLGMLNEIVRARQNISAYMAINMNANSKRLMYTLDRSPHKLKYDTIKNCIFAADIEPSAVDITQLRLWLALVIDDEINPNAESHLDGHKDPLPLPNLESNILCGNSLIDEFEGIKLVKESTIITSGEFQISMNQNEYDVVLNKLVDAQGRLFYCNDTDEKKQILKEISSYKNMIVLKELHDADPAVVERYYESTRMSSKPYVLWQLDFARVFREKGGFDIVIGNPPYVSTKGQSARDKINLEKIYGYADDLYYHFIDKGLKLLCNKGNECFITPDTYFTTLTKAPLRRLLKSNRIVELIQLGHDVFESAMVSTAIILVVKDVPNDSSITKCIDVKNTKYLKDGQNYCIKQKVFDKSINGSFFMPTEFNMALNNNLSKIHDNLLKNWFPLSATSRDIEKNLVELREYRSSLKTADWTLIGMVTEGGVGLQTGNNGRFVGIKYGTKEAERIRATRLKKLADFNTAKKLNHIMPSEEEEIWKLFESLKEQYGRDIFGQGYLYKIVPQNRIKDLSTLTEVEKEKGIEGLDTFVPYDKGDKDGNRWYNETPYLIDWSVDSVKCLKENAGKKGPGSSRFQNAQFYFREGFSYSDIKTFFLKCRLKGVSVHDVKSMSLFPVCDKVPYYYIITLLNTEIIATFVYNFLNNTPSFQINDCRMVPIKIPSSDELAECKDLFDKSVQIQKDYFGGHIDSDERNQKLLKVQKDIDIWACKLFDISPSYLKGNSNYVR